jgi:hypothetical protein
MHVAGVVEWICNNQSVDLRYESDLREYVLWTSLWSEWSVVPRDVVDGVCLWAVCPIRVNFTCITKGLGLCSTLQTYSETFATKRYILKGSPWPSSLRKKSGLAAPVIQNLDKIPKYLLCYALLHQLRRKKAGWKLTKAILSYNQLVSLAPPIGEIWIRP